MGEIPLLSEIRQHQREAGWNDPIPWGEAARPEFPAGLLSPWQRRFVEEVSSETETAPDLAAMLVLSVTSLCCTRRVDVLQRPGFRQPLNLWTLAMLASGNRKTAVFRRATEPIRQYEARQAEVLGPRIAVEQSQLRSLKARLTKAEKAIADLRNSVSEEDRKIAIADAAQLAEAVATYKITRAPLLFLSEATPERIEELVMEQGGRIAVLADENGLIDTLGRYSKSAPNLNTLLATFDGGDVRVGRMRGEDGRGGDRVQRNALTTIGIAPQPEGVMRAFRDNHSFSERGFAWRFLFAMPRDLFGDRTHDTAQADAMVLGDYARHISALLELPDPGNEPCPAIAPTPAATDLLLAFERSLEPQLGPNGELAGLRSWGSKLTSRLARVAGVFHCADNTMKPWEVPLELPTMERAVSLAPYLIAHTRAVLGELGATDALDAAHRAIAWMKRSKTPVFTRHSLNQAVRLPSADEWKEPLEILEERFYIAEVPAEKRAGRGRPPGSSYLVNPKVIR